MRSECCNATAVSWERAHGAHGSAQHVEGEPVATRPHRRSPLVLMAEDDFEMRSLMATALRAMGYHVREFEDGRQLRECLESLKRNGRIADVDLIISDIVMPGASGFEVLVGLDEWRRTIPFIAISAFGDENTHAAAHALGAVAMFDKPFDLEELKALAARLVPPAGASAHHN